MVRLQLCNSLNICVPSWNAQYIFTIFKLCIIYRINIWISSCRVISFDVSSELFQTNVLGPDPGAFGPDPGASTLSGRASRSGAATTQGFETLLTLTLCALTFVGSDRAEPLRPRLRDLRPSSLWRLALWPSWEATAPNTWARPRPSVSGCKDFIHHARMSSRVKGILFKWKEILSDTGISLFWTPRYLHWASIVKTHDGGGARSILAIFYPPLK